MESSNSTFHAKEAIALSDQIDLKFARERLGEKVPKVVRVTDPDGPSTDGGRKARQSMMLVPEKGDGASVLFGFVDMGKRAAEVRAYPLVKQQYETRHQTNIDFSAEDYGKLLIAMREFFDNQKVAFEMVEAMPARAPSRPASVVPKRIEGVPQQSSVVPVTLAFLGGIFVGYLLCWATMFSRS